MKSSNRSRWLQGFLATVLVAVCFNCVAAPAIGPLMVHPANPRYFTDGTKGPDGQLKAVYLTGSHTWSNLMDRGANDPPPVFDFEQYLNLLEKHNHNFIRLWRHEHSIPEDTLFPLPYRRTGPGNALD